MGVSMSWGCVLMLPLALSSLPTSTVSWLSAPAGFSLPLVLSAVFAAGFAGLPSGFGLPMSVRSITEVSSISSSLPLSSASFLLLAAVLTSASCFRLEPLSVFSWSVPSSSVSSSSSASVFSTMLDTADDTARPALAVPLASGLSTRRKQVMVCVLMKVRSAMAVKNSMAASPGGPMTFSIYCTLKAPCLPPGLNTSSPVNGATTLARNIDSQYMAIAIPKNHFHMFAMQMRMSLTPAITRNVGMRKAANPKFLVMKK